jgi:hypothetical protein
MITVIDPALSADQPAAFIVGWARSARFFPSNPPISSVREPVLTRRFFDIRTSGRAREKPPSAEVLYGDPEPPSPAPPPHLPKLYPGHLNPPAPTAVFYGANWQGILNMRRFVKSQVWMKNPYGAARGALHTSLGGEPLYICTQPRAAPSTHNNKFYTNNPGPWHPYPATLSGQRNKERRTGLISYGT